MTRIVLATHSRELKMSLFLALNTLADVSIVATASATAELLSYGKALRPDVVIIETGLPGRDLDDAVERLETYIGPGRILLIDSADANKVAKNHPKVQRFADLGRLIEAVP